MLINSANLKTLFTAYNAAFKQGLGQAASQWQQVATPVPSTTAAEEYAWLGALPWLREWLGDRVVHGIQGHGYTIKNRAFELTVAVPRNAIEDDQYGVYTPLMQEMGSAAGAHPDQLIFGLLAQGREELCYDGAPFFSTEHKVINAKGKEVKVSNVDDDASATTPSWYLLDTRRSLKPLILQTRKEPNFVSKTTETDDNVFWAGEYVYGVDCRRAAGFAFWQLAYASNKALTAENLQAAITAMSTQTGDHGRPLGISPNLLVVPKALRFDAKRLLEAELLVGPNGATTESNVLRGAAELLVADWL